MGIKLLLKTLFCFAVFLFARNSHAFGTIDESVTWATVAQGHHQYGNPDPSPCAGIPITSTQFKLTNSAKIRGTLGLPLAYCSSNAATLSTSSCDDINGSATKCSVLGYDLIGLNLTGDNAFQTSSASAGSINSCNVGETITIGSDGKAQFDNVKLESACTLSTASSQAEYRFNSLSATNGAKLVLTAGDYFIDSLTLGANSQVVLKGDVRLFVKSTSQFTSTTVNSANLYKLQIIGYNSITLTGTSNITANIYSNETLVLNSSAILNGRMSSRYLDMSATASVVDISEPAVFLASC